MLAGFREQCSLLLHNATAKVLRNDVPVILNIEDGKTSTGVSNVCALIPAGSCRKCIYVVENLAQKQNKVEITGILVFVGALITVLKGLKSKGINKQKSHEQLLPVQSMQTHDSNY